MAITRFTYEKKVRLEQRFTEESVENWCPMYGFKKVLEKDKAGTYEMEILRVKKQLAQTRNVECKIIMRKGQLIFWKQAKKYRIDRTAYDDVHIKRAATI